MINITQLKQEIKNFMTYAIPVLDGDIELQERLEYELKKLMNSYKNGEALVTKEFEKAIDAISEFAELAGFDSNDIMYKHYPEILNILAFHKRKVYWKRQK